MKVEDSAKKKKTLKPEKEIKSVKKSLLMEMKGENWAFGKAAEKNPKSLKAPLRRWYSNICPGWKAYQKHLAQKYQGLGILKA
jgi:hypothetical protein